MPLAKQNKEMRDARILARYRHLRKKNPKHTIVSILQEVADDFCLTPATIAKVIKNGGHACPDPKTVSKYTRPGYCQYTLF
jgi:hypothetical protein